MLIFKDKMFWKQMVKLALPIAGVSLLTALLNVLDSLMVTELGENSMAGVLLANQVVFIFQVVIFTIAGAGVILISQYYGNNDNDKIPPICGICQIVSVSIGIIFTVICFFFAEPVLKLFGKDNTIAIVEGTKYLKIAGLSSIPFAISTVLSTTSRGFHKVKLAVVVIAISVVMNGILNYIFMFGKLGFKPMGVVGAGLGTLISRLIEITIMIIGCIVSKSMAVDVKRMFKFNRKEVKKFLKIMTPTLCNEVLWCVASTTYFLAYGRMSDSVNILASLNIVLAIEKLLFTMLIGIGNSAGIIAGNYIGEGNKEYAYKKSKMCIQASVMFGFVLMLFYILAGKVAPMFYSSLNIQVEKYIFQLCCAYGIFMPIRAVVYSLIVGVLRAGGDTKYCMFVDCIPMWFLSVPITFVTALYFQLPIWAVVSLTNSVEIIKALMVLKRFKSKKWINSFTEPKQKLELIEKVSEELFENELK